MVPAYDYGCSNCDKTFEVRHPMKESPIVVCPKCSSKTTYKIPTLIGIVTRSSRSVGMDRAVDQVKRNVEMRDEMKRDMGIEKISPLRNSTMKQVYDDAKAQKSEIKESMAAQAEKRSKETALKQREWSKKALQRMPQRRQEMSERKAAAAAAKRAIRI